MMNVYRLGLFLSLVSITGCSGLTAVQNPPPNESLLHEAPASEDIQVDNHDSQAVDSEATGQDTAAEPEAEAVVEEPEPVEELPPDPPKVIDPEGMTLETRFPVPSGYHRIPGKDSGYADYLRKLPLLPDGSPVLLFNGNLKEYQAGHVAVVDMDVGNRDLQQCADAAMRLRTEYLYHSDQHDKMIYHLTNRQELSWPKWKTGYRLKYLGERKTEYIKMAGAGGSYETYRKWLDTLMMYGGVDSVKKFDATALELDDIEPGDVFASTGHLIIIIDVVQNDDGDKKFMLAQSYMPAQQIEILKNPYDASTPWYSLEMVRQVYASGNPFTTPEWQFPPPGPNVYRMR